MRRKNSREEPEKIVLRMDGTDTICRITGLTPEEVTRITSKNKKAG